MRGVVFSALHATAAAAHQYVSDVPGTDAWSARSLFHCKGCTFYYTGDQVSYVESIGHVCKGCQKKIVQMILL